MDGQEVSGEVMCGSVRYFDVPPKHRYAVSRQMADTPPSATTIGISNFRFRNVFTGFFDLD